MSSNLLTIVMWKMTISSNLTVLNLPHCVQSLLNQTLRPFIFPTFLTSSVLSQNPSNSTSLATETTEISTKTVSTPSGKTRSTCSTLAIWKSGENSLRAVAFQSTPTTTTVSLELSMKDWQNNASSNTTSIQRKLTTVNTLRKSNSNRVNVALPYSSTACG